MEGVEVMALRGGVLYRAIVGGLRGLAQRGGGFRLRLLAFIL